MAEVSGVKMTPVDGGDSVAIPSGKTTIGRGTFLQVSLFFHIIYDFIVVIVSNIFVSFFITQQQCHMLICINIY